MESKFVDLRAEEMDYINGGGIWDWVVKFIETVGVFEAFIEFGKVFSEGYEESNKIGG